MSAPLRHILSQREVIASLGRAAITSLTSRAHKTPLPALPGPWIEADLPPRPTALVDDYIRHVGGDVAWYRGVLPPHFFPQWGFPLVARALAPLPYPLTRAVNAGCRFEVRAPLPRSERLSVRARLESIDDDGRRALVTTRIITGTQSAPEALIADMRALVPLARGKADDKGAPPKARPTVPEGAREIASFDLGKDAGFDFAKLTGDFNPIHWIAPYARAAGFASTILHGFATLARAVEALNRAVFAGEPSRLSWVDVRFTRPLVLPARVGVYLGPEESLFVGDAPAGRAYLEGRFCTSG